MSSSKPGLTEPTKQLLIRDDIQDLKNKNQELTTNLEKVKKELLLFKRAYANIKNMKTYWPARQQANKLVMEQKEQEKVRKDIVDMTRQLDTERIVLKKLLVSARSLNKAIKLKIERGIDVKEAEALEKTKQDIIDSTSKVLKLRRDLRVSSQRITSDAIARALITESIYTEGRKGDPSFNAIPNPNVDSESKFDSESVEKDIVSLSDIAIKKIDRSKLLKSTEAIVGSLDRLSRSVSVSVSERQRLNPSQDKDVEQEKHEEKGKEDEAHKSESSKEDEARNSESSKGDIKKTPVKPKSFSEIMRLDAEEEEKAVKKLGWYKKVKNFLLRFIQFRKKQKQSIKELQSRGTVYTNIHHLHSMSDLSRMKSRKESDMEFELNKMKQDLEYANKDLEYRDAEIIGLKEQIEWLKQNVKGDMLTFDPSSAPTVPELSSSQDDMLEYQKEFDALIQKLELEKEHKEQILKVQQNVQRKYEAQIRGLNKTMSTMQTDFNSKVLEYENRIERLKQESYDRANMSDDPEKDNAKYLAQLDDQKQIFDDQLNALKNTVSKRDRQIEGMQKLQTMHEQEVARYQKNEKLKDNDIEALRHELEECKRTIHEFTNVEDTCQEMQIAMSKKEAECEEYKKEIGILKADLSKCVRDAKTTITKTTTHIPIEKYNAILAQNNQKVRDYNKKLKDFQDEVRNTQLQMERMMNNFEGEKHNLLSQINRMQREIDRCNTYKKHTNRSELLNERRIRKMDMNAYLPEPPIGSIEINREWETKFERMIEAHKHEMDALVNQCNEYNSELKAEKAALEATTNVLKSRLKEMEQLGQLEQGIVPKGSTGELEQISENIKLTEKITALESEKKQIETQYTTLQASMETLAKSRQEMKEVKTQQENELNALKIEHSGLTREH